MWDYHSSYFTIFIAGSISVEVYDQDVFILDDSEGLSGLTCNWKNFKISSVNKKQ